MDTRICIQTSCYVQWMQTRCRLAGWMAAGRRSRISQCWLPRPQSALCGSWLVGWQPATIAHCSVTWIASGRMDGRTDGWLTGQSSSWWEAISSQARWMAEMYRAFHCVSLQFQSFPFPLHCVTISTYDVLSSSCLLAARIGNIWVWEEPENLNPISGFRLDKSVEFLHPLCLKLNKKLLALISVNKKMNPRAVFKDKESVLFILQVHLEIPSIYPSFSPSLTLHCWVTAGNFVAFLMIFNKHYKMASLCSVLLRLHFSISSLAGSHNLWRQVTERDPWDGWQQRSISVSHSTIANFHPKAPAAPPGVPPGTYSRRVIITIIGRECGYPRNVFVSG